VLDAVEVIGIDEVQFFDAELVKLVMELVSRGQAGCPCGLDTTFSGVPFPPVPELLALSDETVSSPPSACSAALQLSIRKRLGSSQSLVLVGAAGL